MTKLGYSFVLILGYVITLCEADYCWYDTFNYIDCPYSSCCGSGRYVYCCSYTPTGTIVGSVLGSVIFIVIVVSIACCFCACCPGYRYRRNQGPIITTVQPGPCYQTIPNAPYPGNTGPYPPQNAGPYPPQNTGPYRAMPAGGYNYPPPSYQK